MLDTTSPAATVLVKTTSGSTAVTVVNNLSDGGTLLTPKTTTGGIYIGLTVSGTGIPAGAKITAVNGTTVTLSAAATATAASIEMTVTGRVLGSWQSDADRPLYGKLDWSIVTIGTGEGIISAIGGAYTGQDGSKWGANSLEIDNRNTNPTAPTNRPAGPVTNAIILV